MSAPLIIPFNFQPILTASTTSAYTVPAGKYAKVHIGNAILPTLNSVAMYQTKTAPSTLATVLTTAFIMPLPPNTHRVNGTLNAGTIYLGYANDVTSSAQYFRTGTGSLALIIPVPNLTTIWAIGSSATTISSGTYDVYNGPAELWLKAGDVLGFSEGGITYTEYDVIS